MDQLPSRKLRKFPPFENLKWWDCECASHGSSPTAPRPLPSSFNRSHSMEDVDDHDYEVYHAERVVIRASKPLLISVRDSSRAGTPSQESTTKTVLSDSPGCKSQGVSFPQTHGAFRPKHATICCENVTPSAVGQLEDATGCYGISDRRSISSLPVALEHPASASEVMEPRYGQLVDEASISGRPNHAGDKTRAPLEILGPFRLREYSSSTQNFMQSCSDNPKNDTAKGKTMVGPGEPGQGRQRISKARTEEWVSQISPKFLQDSDHAFLSPARQSVTTKPCQQGVTAPTDPSFAVADNVAMNRATNAQHRGFDHGQQHRAPHHDTNEPKDIRGNFIPVSNSLKKLSHSPKYEQAPQVINVQLSLTQSELRDLMAARMHRMPTASHREDASDRDSRERRIAHDTDHGSRSSRENRVAGRDSRSRSPEKLRSRSPGKIRSGSPERLPQTTYTPPTRERARSPEKIRSRSPERRLRETTCTAHIRERTSSPKKVRSRSPEGRHPENNYTAHTRERNSSPEKVRSQSPERLPQTTYITHTRDRARSPAKVSSHSKRPEDPRVAYGFEAAVSPQSPTRQKEFRFAKSSTATSLSPSRKGKGTPPRIDTDLARFHYKQAASQRGRVQLPVAVHNPPEVPLVPAQYLSADDSSSDYSQDLLTGRFLPPDFTPSPVRPPSPLNIQKEDSNNNHASVLRGYIDWINKPYHSEEETEDRRLSFTKNNRESYQAEARSGSSNGVDQIFTPLPFAFPDVHPGQRVASKTLIGEKGWLEKTASTTKNKPKPTEKKVSPTRKTGFLDKVVKKAKEMMVDKNNDQKAHRNSREAEKADKNQPNGRDLQTSLNTREQSLLYCEMEYALAIAMNDYIQSQQNAGRHDLDKLKRISDSWQQKGRPRVMGWRYDIETQLDLIRLHVNEFKFYGHAATPSTILAIIDFMRVNARALRIRTYCQPDTVIAKQLNDSRDLFNLLGCPEPQQIQLAEITEFFKACVKRERHMAEKEATNPNPVRRDKTASGEKWQANNQTDRTNTHGGMKMDPTDYDDDQLE
ncbi:hypothetical protein B0T17DRAFT_8136 [Bombardia bombarda]|uniref:Uncharacterized protein n=1 Tax=Bombardia bombarda TaxID=252184 RepID=A0AA39XI98_9PEZI|nr:hypothetical protein B0T17DRAFT_8136 [Bombardia bombarda]